MNLLKRTNDYLYHQQDPLASLPSHHEKNQQRMIPPSPAQTQPEPTKAHG